jgi:hypothetical protein
MNNLQIGKRQMHGSHGNRRPIAWLAAGALLLATALPTTAAAAGGEQWEYDATTYLWGAGIKATTPTGGDIDISFSDIVDDLDMAFMGDFGAHKGKWSLLANAIYLDVSQGGAGRETIPVLGGAFVINTTVSADLDMKAWITAFGGGYNVVDNERATLDLVGGARYFWLDIDLKLDLITAAGPLMTSRAAKVSDSDSVWDGVVGVKGKINLDNNWYLPYYADVGTGQSDLTWQAMAGVGYKFKWGDVQLAYRHLDYDFKSDFLLKDMSLSGPLLGASFYF